MSSDDNFTKRAKEAMRRAATAAARLHHNYVNTEHMLLGVLGLGSGVAHNVLVRLGVDPDDLRAAIVRRIKPGPKDAQLPLAPQLTPSTQRALLLARREAKRLGHNYIGSEHILLGLLAENEGAAAKLLIARGLTLEKVRRQVRVELDPDAAEGPISGAAPSGLFGAEGSSGSGNEGGNDPLGAQSGNEEELPMRDPVESNRRAEKMTALKAFGRDLTEIARRGETDPVIGRTAEIRRVIQILCRRTKNNPVLIGEAGVGKTAIVEGLAQAVANGTVPELLAGKRIIALDLALMVAGTKYRGQFEERIKLVMEEIKRAKNVILFIDELHTIIGAGGAEGSMDAANILKPALSRGEVQCIGATTLAEYRKSVEKDPALERRFQSIKVEPPSVADALKILQGLAPKYEAHHHCRYTPEALVAAVRYSDRYITERNLPDKAIDILDEAGSRVRIDSFETPQEIKEISKKIDAVVAEKKAASDAENYERAGALLQEEKKLCAQRDMLTEAWRRERDTAETPVTEDHVLHVVSDWTGIPLTRMEKSEAQKLLDIEKDLQKSVIAQDEACTVIARALRRSRAALKDPRRPIGSFLFLGPTGVGKTHLAKTLAEHMFGRREALIQIDMSEYMEKHTVSRLIGSPPGYVGYEEGGMLTEAVRRKPYSVVLFDEIEKAHPDVIQLLLQVLEDGRLTDSLGRTVDFRNTILIMTSNVGAEILQKNVSMGFDVGLDANLDFEKTKARLAEETKRVFKPEFLNRLTEIIYFRSLTKENMREIVRIEAREVAKRLETQGVELVLDENALMFLVDVGYDEKFGARPLRRAVERNLEDPLAEEILRNGTLPAGTIYVSVKDNALAFKFPPRSTAEKVAKEKSSSPATESTAPAPTKSAAAKSPDAPAPRRSRRKKSE